MESLRTIKKQNMGGKSKHSGVLPSCHHCHGDYKLAVLESWLPMGP